METSVKIEVDRIYRFDNGGQLKGFADIIIGGLFAVKGFRIVDGKKGLFISMPSEMGKDGTWYNTFKPITKEAQAELNKTVIDAYNAG
ncbi:MAG: SpoVG family protein [Candidatus Omnitrophica bacterium]|nr:SpoVG family protein [Candidatus Omnitrophota bacterium]